MIVFAGVMLTAVIDKSLNLSSLMLFTNDFNMGS